MSTERSYTYESTSIFQYGILQLQEGKQAWFWNSSDKEGQWMILRNEEVHAGVDAESGYGHTIIATSANIHDVSETAISSKKMMS